MSQEITPYIQITPPVIYSAYNADGYDETGLSDVAKLKPANLILVQPTTREPKDARPGQFLDSLTDEVHDSIVLVPLRTSKGRVLFPPGEIDLDAEPICRSDDGIVPSPYAKQQQSRTCATCPMSRWVGGKKPPCSDKRRMLVATKDTGLPRFFTAGGKSIPGQQKMLDRINEYVRVNAANMKAGKLDKDGNPLKPLALFDFFFTLSSEKVVGKFSYFVARFDNVKRVANPGDFGSLFEEFVIKRRLQAEEDAEAAKVVASEASADEAVSSIVDAEFVPEDV
jgi:hypothetical protein